MNAVAVDNREIEEVIRGVTDSARMAELHHEAKVLKCLLAPELTGPFLGRD